MKKVFFVRFLVVILIALAEQGYSQSCNIIPLIKERLKCACSNKNYSNFEYGSNKQTITPYTITGWIRPENPLTSGVVVYALYTTTGDRVFSFHLVSQSSKIKVEIYGKNTNRLYINNYPYQTDQWAFTAVTIYTQSFDIFIMRPNGQGDLIVLSQNVSLPDFGQITSGYNFKACINRYETFTSFCGNLAYFSLFTMHFKGLTSEGKLLVMYSGGEPKILLKYQFTNFKMNDYETDLSNQGYNIYQPQYELKDNNANQFDMKKDRPKIPIQINPKYKTDGSFFPYPGFTVSFWFYIDSITNPVTLFHFLNEQTTSTIISLSAINDVNGYYKFCLDKECKQHGNANPSSKWNLMIKYLQIILQQKTFTLRNQQIQDLQYGGIITYYIDNLYQNQFTFVNTYIENAFETNVIDFSPTQSSSVYLKNMIIVKGVILETQPSSCQINNCNFQLFNNICQICETGYSLTSQNTCDAVGTCGSTSAKQYIKDAQLNICQEKCEQSCNDCDLVTRVCNQCYDNSNSAPSCQCPSSKIYQDEQRGICSDSISDKHLILRSQSEYNFNNFGEIQKQVTISKKDYNIIPIVALTSLKINKNSNSQNDIRFYIEPSQNSINLDKTKITHYKNANIQIDNLIYSYMISYIEQQSFIARSVQISIPPTNNLKINGNGSFIYKYSHNIRDYTPYVSLFLTGYGISKQSKVDLKISSQDVTGNDLSIKIESLIGDSPISYVNINIVFSRFASSEHQVFLPDYILTYPSDFQGTRQSTQDFTVTQEDDLYVPFIYGLTSITYLTQQDLDFSLLVKKNTSTKYNYSLKVESDSSIKYLSFTLLRFQPQKSVGGSVVECYPTCSSCSSSTNTCQSCTDPLRTPPYCKCKDNYFSQTDGTCAQCHQRCKTCELNPKNCLVCNSDHANFPDCNCLPGYIYVGTDETTCKPCGNRCAECSVDVENCTKCYAGRINFPNCSCPNGFYDDNINKSCQQCPPSCKKCTNPTTCSECSNGYVLQGVQCIDCDYKCSTCSGNPSNCTACKTDKRINIPQCICKDGYFDQNNNDPECLECHIYCKTCENQNDMCKSCNGNRIFNGINKCDCPNGSLNDINGSAYCETCNISGAIIEYSQDYSEIYIKFTYDVIPNPQITEKISEYSDLNCKEVLDQSIINNLGQGQKCALSADKKMFIIKLGYGSTISSNVQFKFNDFKIKSNKIQCSNIHIVEFGINSVQKPNTSEPPIAVLSTKTQIFNICSKIEIFISSVTRSGGRSLKDYVWSEFTNQVTIPPAYVNQPILVFEPNTLVKNKSYKFILNYSSSYDVKGSTSIQIQTLDNESQFSFSVVNGIDGSNSFKFYIYQGIQLKAHIKINSCSSTFEYFTVSSIQWKQKFGNYKGNNLNSDKTESQIQFISESVFSFSIQPFSTLQINQYEFEVLTKIIYLEKEYQLSQTVIVEIIQSPLVVQIIGGDTVRQWNKNFDLIAHVFDPNTNTVLKDPNQLSIQWKCTIDGTSQDCLWQDGTLFKDFASYKLKINVPERTFKYFQRIFLDVIIRKPNLDGSVISGSHSSEILFLDYEIESFQIQIPYQLGGSEMISFSDQILFNINDTDLLQNFSNSIDDLTFKTTITYESNTYFQTTPFLSFSQLITIQNSYMLNSLNISDRLKIVFSIESISTSTQYQTSFSLQALDSPKNCEISISNNSISINKCQSQFLPLKYKIGFYVSKKYTTLDQFQSEDNHEYISLFGEPFQISNIFYHPSIDISFDFIDDEQTPGYLVQLFTQDSQGSVSRQLKKIQNLTVNLKTDSQTVSQLPAQTIISIMTIIEYLNTDIISYPDNLKFEKLMIQMRPLNDDTISHFCLYWSQRLEKYNTSNDRRLLKNREDESNQDRFLDLNTNDYQIQTLFEYIDKVLLPKIFEPELIWKSFKQFNVYHSQERLLFSTFRLIESLILSTNKFESLLNLCQKAIELVQINNKPIQYYGKTLQVYLAKYTSKLLLLDLSIQVQNPSSSFQDPYQIIRISQQSNEIFKQTSSFPKGIQRTPIVYHFIRQNSKDIKLAEIYPIQLTVFGDNFDEDHAVCITYRQQSQSTMTSIISNDGEWTSDDCKTVVQENGRDVICYCKTLDPIVLLEDTNNIFLNPSPTDLHKMKDIIKYPILILLLAQSLLYVIFVVYSVAKDEIDLGKVSSKVAPYSLLELRSAVSLQKLETFEQNKLQLIGNEQEIENQQQQMLRNQEELKIKILKLQQDHDDTVKIQQQQIKNIQDELKLKTEKQQQAYEQKIKDITQKNEILQLTEQEKSKKLQEIEQNFQQQQQEQQERFKLQEQQILNKQQNQLKAIEEKEKTVKKQIEVQEQNMKVFQMQLDPQEEKMAPKNPIHRVVWFMSRPTLNEIPSNQVMKQPLGKSTVFDKDDVSPIYRDSLKNGLNLPPDNHGLLNENAQQTYPSPNKFNKKDNGILSLQLLDEAITPQGSQPILGGFPQTDKNIFTADMKPHNQQTQAHKNNQPIANQNDRNTPNYDRLTQTTQNNLTFVNLDPYRNTQNNQKLNQQREQAKLRSQNSFQKGYQYKHVTFSIILKGYFYLHEFFSAIITQEHSISRTLRFSLIYLKYMAMALILGKIQNGKFNMNMIYSVPLAFVISIISNIIIFIIKYLIRNQGLKKAFGLIFLLLSLIVVVFFLATEFLSIKAPAQSWFYAYVFAIGADFIVIEFIIVVMKFLIFESLFIKIQHLNELQMELWKFISTNDITDYLTQTK